MYEGADVQLTCNLRANYLPVNNITWFNNQGVGVRGSSKYALLQTSAWANLTVRDAHESQDSGQYRCSTSNAVGGTEINITLVVKSKVGFFLLLLALLKDRKKRLIALFNEVQGPSAVLIFLFIRAPNATQCNFGQSDVQQPEA